MKRPYNYKNIVGLRKGHLTCIEDSGLRTKEGGVLWSWLCDCGSIVNRNLTYVKKVYTCGNKCPLSKNIRSIKCTGVIRKLKSKPGETGARQLYGTYKRRCLKKKVPFNLSLIEFKEITKKNCTYCGRKPYAAYNNKDTGVSIRAKENGRYIYNSVDRLIPSIGYVLGNVTPSCRVCNIMKWDLTPEQFKERVKNIYDHYVSRESF